jgi:hypothetical protein
MIEKGRRICIANADYHEVNSDSSSTKAFYP